MMDSASQYTMDTRNWLNRRFSLRDDAGVYIPNQPAYGFSAAAFRLEEYARMYAILHVLNDLAFDSVLDVGSADGYGPALITHLFGAEAFGTDLSEQAVARAAELFGGKGVASDAHRLPFRDGAFDVCICSEVLEHVVDPAAVIGELFRVARYHVVISTPRAPSAKARENHFRTLDPNEPHAHIQFFTDDDMRALCGQRSRYQGARTKVVNRLFNRLAWCDSATYRQREAYFRFMSDSTAMGEPHLNALYEMLIGRYKHTPPWKKRWVTPDLIAALLCLDNRIARLDHRTALDHLVVIPKQTDLNSGKHRLSEKEILGALLGGFRVEEYRRPER